MKNNKGYKYTAKASMQYWQTFTFINLCNIIEEAAR